MLIKFNCYWHYAHKCAWSDIKFPSYAIPNVKLQLKVFRILVSIMHCQKIFSIDNPCDTTPGIPFGKNDWFHFFLVAISKIAFAVLFIASCGQNSLIHGLTHSFAHSLTVTVRSGCFNSMHDWRPAIFRL